MSTIRHYLSEMMLALELINDEPSDEKFAERCECIAAALLFLLHDPWDEKDLRWLSIFWSTVLAKRYTGNAVEYWQERPKQTRSYMKTCQVRFVLVGSGSADKTTRQEVLKMVVALTGALGEMQDAMPPSSATPLDVASIRMLTRVEYLCKAILKTPDKRLLISYCRELGGFCQRLVFNAANHNPQREPLLRFWEDVLRALTRAPRPSNDNSHGDIRMVLAEVNGRLINVVAVGEGYAGDKNRDDVLETARSIVEACKPLPLFRQSEEAHN
ncbi:MAG TPA: hypothetical protein VGP13_01760 [Candidatus Paceibacterota bacterium]|jgi:hypothetical protein|nr:hypothetical protein [Candidatus Paceibacterota bacterium]